MESKDKSKGGYPQGTGFQPGGYTAGYGEVVYNKIPSGPGSSLEENGDVKGFDFNEQSIQKSFIRKVYSVFMCQLLVTLAFVTLFVYNRPIKIWIKENAYMFWVALVIVLVCLIAMACCDGARRQAPRNVICLGVFTVAEIFLLGVSSSVFDSYTVMMVLGITAAVCLALMLFALQTKWDYTALRSVLLCAVVVLLMFGIIMIFVQNKTISLINASLAALIFSLYLILDTHLMMGGKLRYSISPEEFIFAALNLYLDGFNVFIFVVNSICRCAKK